MPITKSSFGPLPDGSVADLYTLTNSHGLVAKVTTFGAILTELYVPDRAGKLANVVLGFSTLAPYLKEHPYFGATIGRYANRIAQGTFTLNDKRHQIPKNDKGVGALHGGTKGFDKQNWKASISGEMLTLTHQSPDGDQGFPGAVNAVVTYELTDKNELALTFQATTDAPTVVNLCNHSYFNLHGVGPTTIMDHLLKINASKYTPVNEVLIPTGQLAPVAGTLLDFTKPTVIGDRAAQVSGGYDHNFVINHATPGDLTLAVTVSDPISGRTMDVLTTQPGIQFYAGNFLSEEIIGNGGAYQKHSGFCLETQHFPDSPNHPNFPTTTLNPGQKYFHRAIYKFRIS